MAIFNGYVSLPGRVDLVDGFNMFQPWWQEIIFNVPFLGVNIWCMFGMFDSNRFDSFGISSLSKDIQQVMSYGNAHRIHCWTLHGSIQASQWLPALKMCGFNTSAVHALVDLMQSLLGSNHISYIHVNPHFTSHIHMSQHGSTSLLVKNPTLTLW